MKRVVKSVIAGILGVSLLCSVNAKAEVTKQASEVSSEELVAAEIVVPKDVVMQNVARVIANGEVDGYGVRLRKNPSSSATVLELMYDGENVYVNIGKSVVKNGTLWYYLKRMKTGTWGYANGDYILY